jgi:hypothetical protein
MNQHKSLCRLNLAEAYALVAEEAQLLDGRPPTLMGNEPRVPAVTVGRSTRPDQGRALRGITEIRP